MEQYERVIEFAKLANKLVDAKASLNAMQQNWENNKELFLEAYETLAELLAWYTENKLELEKTLSVGSSANLNKIIRKTQVIASKAVVL